MPFMFEGKGDIVKITVLIFSRKDFLSRIIFCHLSVYNVMWWLPLKRVIIFTWKLFAQHIARVISDRKDNRRRCDSRRENLRGWCIHNRDTRYTPAHPDVYFPARQ